MVKKILIIILVSIVLLFAISNSFYKNQEESSSTTTQENSQIVQEDSMVLTDTPTNTPTDFQEYNFQFAEGEVIPILEGLIGETGTLAFYLPKEKYIEVNSGDSFGVAFALNNPNPSGENYFEWAFTPDSSNLENCGTTGESWIGLGKTSYGKIPKGWIDMSTVYFEFPEDISCTARFNFEVTKDSMVYGTEVLEFRIS